ncbi:hypothetical protein D3C80_976560 [compost metagenome]
MLLHAAVFTALGFRPLTRRFRIVALGGSVRLHFTNAGKLCAEAFQCGRHRPGFIPPVLSGYRHIVAAIAQRADIRNQRGERVADEVAHGEIKRGDDGGENDDGTDDHHIGLLFHRRVQRLMRNIHQHDPGGVETGNRERVDETVIGRVGIEAEIFDQPLLAGSERRLNGVCAISVIGLHVLLGRQRHQPLAAL